MGPARSTKAPQVQPNFREDADLIKETDDAVLRKQNMPDPELILRTLFTTEGL